ncbi:DEAD/DEAH box helicase [Kordiimonas sp.]|uniref:DEAD/DEAH box helicase n=1 Tax=Kordiimonas sp. TaxID=1970157 RepID=UPI003A944EC4
MDLSAQIVKFPRAVVTGDTFTHRAFLRTLPGTRHVKNTFSFDATPQSAAMLAEVGTKLCDRLAKMAEVAENDTPAVPVEFERLRQNQVDGVGFISTRADGLLDHRMGLGKTFQLIATILAKRPSRVLIMCPQAVIGVWVGELEKWWNAGKILDDPQIVSNRKRDAAKVRDAMLAEDHGDGYHVRTLRLDGEYAKRTSAGKAEFVRQFWSDSQPSNECRIVIVNYESAWVGDLGKAIVDCTGSRFMAVCDEAQKVKGHSTNVSKWSAKLALQSRWKYALSGTPTPNSPLDIFGIARFLDPAYFGTVWSAFQAEYAELDPVYNKPVRFRNQEKLGKIMAKFTHRCHETESLNLPPLSIVDIPVRLSDQAMKIYNQMKRESIAQLNESETLSIENVLTRTIRLRQIASGNVVSDDGAVLRIDDSKLKVLQDLIESTDQPVTVYCEFSSEVEAAREIFEKCGRRHGEVSGNEKTLTKHGKFPDHLDAMAVQIKSGGSGIDLTRSPIGIFLNLPFSPGDYEQTIARNYRPGQTSNTTIYRILATGTVDVRVASALREKQSVLDELTRYFELSGKDTDATNSDCDGSRVLPVSAAGRS